MSPTDPRRDDEPSPLAPITPEGLARGYADIAAGYHRRLPDVERLAREARDGARAAVAVAARSEAASLEAAETSGKCLGRLDEVLRAVESRPRLPSLSQHDPEEELTLNGKPVPVENGNVTLTKSEFETLKQTAKVVRFGVSTGKSLLQKVFVTALYAGLLALAGIAGAELQALWHAAHPQYAMTPPVVVAPKP